MVYSLFAALINALVVYGSLYFLPLSYEGVQGYNPIVAGVSMFPAAFTAAPSVIVAGFIVTKTGDFKIITVLGWAAVTIGMGVCILLDVNTTIV
jgi:hypothetical protein